MVNSVGPNNNSNTVVSKKNSHIRAQQNTSKHLSKDTVSFNALNEKEQSINKLQIASLAVGTLASAALVAYLMKSSGIFGKNRALFKEIKKANIPDLVRKKLLFEYNKFIKSDMDVDNSQNYIANVLKMPWGKTEQKTIDIDKAKAILDKKLIGMENVKKELISYFTVRNYNIANNITNDEGNILCLVGPPGVAKTSIGKIVAEIMDKPFGRMSVGGKSTASDISGGKRLWKASEPGKIVQLLQDAGVGDPVILMDELDKMGRSVEHGDPAATLLDVFEPKQCKNFTDEYIGLPYDLSNITFITTANDLNGVDKALKDRLTVINIGAYSKATKSEICKANILEKMEHLKIDGSKVRFETDGVNEIVNSTNDQGARKTLGNLKRVFDFIIETLGKNENNKISVNRNFVINALKNRQDA